MVTYDEQQSSYIMAAQYGSFNGFEGYTLDEIREFNEEDQIAIMTRWFDAQFEDPQNDTPYNKDAGGYVYNWGGPFDASEQIQEEFSNVVDFDTMMLAADEVQRGGMIEWAPKSDGDFYAHPDDDADGIEYGDAVEGGEPIVMADLLPEPEARRNVAGRVEELETLILPLSAMLQEQQPPFSMGHNNPPERLDGLHGISSDDWFELMSAIADIKQQTSSDMPDVDILNQRGGLLKSAGAFILKLIAEKAKVGVDAIVGTLVVGSLAYLINNAEVIAAALTSVAQSVLTWINSITMAL